MRLRSCLICLLALLLAGCPPILGTGGNDDDDTSGGSDDDDAGDDDDGVLDEVQDPESLIGRTFLLDLANANFIEPAGIGSLVATQMKEVRLLMAATGASDLGDGEMAALLGQGDVAGGQDLDLSTVSLPNGDWDNPIVTFGPVDLLGLGLTLEGAPLDLRDARFGVSFLDDGRSAAGGWLTAVLDTRSLDDVLDPDGEDGALCDLLSETVGVDCEECGPPDTGVFCLPLAIDDIDSTEVIGLELVPVP